MDLFLAKLDEVFPFCWQGDAGKEQKKKISPSFHH